MSSADWLGIATKGLCREAKERIAGEIEAHFIETVENELESGSSHAEAQRKAITWFSD